MSSSARRARLRALLSSEQCSLLATIFDPFSARMAEQLNKSGAPVVLMLPLKSVSMIDESDGPFHDTAANQALFGALRQYCGPNVRIREVDANINDTEFAHALADEMLALVT